MQTPKYRVAIVDVGHNTFKIEEWPLTEVLGPIDVGVKLHLEVYESWKHDVFSARNVMVIGRGVFAGGRIIGCHRLVAVFRSPITRGLHVSAMGGAAYRFVGTGLHALAIEGRADEPSVLLVFGDEKGVKEIKVERIGEETLWEVYEGYKGAIGVRALTLYLLDTYEDYFKEYNARSIVVGPAAVKTIMGALFSLDADPKTKRIRPGAIDSAARGGGGSVLYHAHGIAAIVFGGKYSPMSENPKLGDISLLDSIAEKVHGKRYTEVLMATTRKYRFDSHLGTGGTFGVNYVHYRELVPMFGYNTIYYSKAIRAAILEKVLKYFWKPFQDEVFKSGKRPWYNCGEPCPVVCKKVWRGVKVDYEPFNGMGPMIGVLSLEDAADLVELVDDYGFDVIELGHVISWLFDLLHRGLLSPRELGLEARPYFDPIAYDVEEHSKRNARLAVRIIEMLIRGGNEIIEHIARHGIRSTARMLNKKYAYRTKMYAIGFQDVAVYAAYGEEGYMTPNYYWTPGMIAPLYILGRYWTNYTPTFSDPEHFAESSLKRALWEYLIDNAGFCRFHRGWAEKMLSLLYREIWGVNVDLEKHAKKTYKKIIEYQEKAGAAPVFWESRKTIDIISTIAAEMGNEEWVRRFAEDYRGAAREWWEKFTKTLKSLLES